MSDSNSTAQTVATDPAPTVAAGESNTIATAPAAADLNPAPVPLAAVTDLETLLQRVDEAVAKVESVASSVDVASLREELDSVKAAFAAMLADFESIKAEIEKIGSPVVAFFKRHMGVSL
jgi:hypothetical protein